MMKTAKFVGGPLDGRITGLYGYPPANRFRGDDGRQGGKAYTLEDSPEGLIYKHASYTPPQEPTPEAPSPTKRRRPRNAERAGADDQ